MAAETRRTTAPDGAVVAYDVQGEGPTLVLLHGRPDSWYSVDQRGFGDSSRPPSRYRVEDLCARESRLRRMSRAGNLDPFRTRAPKALTALLDE